MTEYERNDVRARAEEYFRQLRHATDWKINRHLIAEKHWRDPHSPQLPNRDISFHVRCRNRLHRLTLTPQGALVIHDHDNDALKVFANLNGGKNRCEEVREAFRYGYALHQALKPWVWGRAKLIKRRTANRPPEREWWYDRRTEDVAMFKEHYLRDLSRRLFERTVKDCHYEVHLRAALEQAFEGFRVAGDIDVPLNLGIELTGAKEYSTTTCAMVPVTGIHGYVNTSLQSLDFTLVEDGKRIVVKPHSDERSVYYRRVYIRLPFPWIWEVAKTGVRTVIDAAGRSYAVLARSPEQDGHCITRIMVIQQSAQWNPRINNYSPLGAAPPQPPQTPEFYYCYTHLDVITRLPDRLILRPADTESTEKTRTSSIAFGESCRGVEQPQCVECVWVDKHEQRLIPSSS